MPLVGLLDVAVGIVVLFHPCRALLAWMALWSVFTALLRPLAGLGWWEFLERGGNYGPPIAFLLLAHPQQLGWFDRIEPAPVSGEFGSRRLKSVLPQAYPSARLSSLHAGRGA